MAGFIVFLIGIVVLMRMLMFSDTRIKAVFTNSVIVSAIFPLIVVMHVSAQSAYPSEICDRLLGEVLSVQQRIAVGGYLSIFVIAATWYFLKKSDSGENTK